MATPTLDLNTEAAATAKFAGQGMLSKVSLSVSCSNLVNLDYFSKSDPMCILYVQDTTGKWVEYGRTEVMRDNLNPKFVKNFVIDYHFEEVQHLRFAIVDVDNPNKSIAAQDYVGEMTCRLAEILTARGQKLVRELKNANAPNSRRGTITISAEEVHELNYTVKLQFGARHLDKKDFFGKSDPFLVISRSHEGGSFIPVIKTEVIKKTLDPVWRPFTTTVTHLCNGDFDRPLLFEVFDWNRSGKHELIGTFKSTLRELSGETTTAGSSVPPSSANARREFPLTDPAKVGKKKGYTNSGTLIMLTCEITQNYSFIDYLAGGCEISLIVAIDFTASNGNPMYANSLHFSNPYEPNEYLKALIAVGEVLAPYDSDRRIAVYGFGAKLPPSGNVSHCFPLTGDYSNPEVVGLEGVINAYRATLANVTLYGPTIFSQIIRVAATIASRAVTQSQQAYYILLILTDGCIDDMNDTLDEIVRATQLPLSIVIVGVGTADFSNMEVLDADVTPLRSTAGQTASRDIVQFVPFRNFRDSPARLARETLAEIPTQLLSFFKSKNIVPNPPRQFDAAAAGDPRYSVSITAGPRPSMSVQPPAGGYSANYAAYAATAHPPPMQSQTPGYFQPPPPGSGYPPAGYPGGYPGAGPQPGGYPSAGAPGGAQPPASGYPGAGTQPGAYPPGAYPGAQPPASGYPGAGTQPGGYPPAGAPGGTQPPASGYPGAGPQPGTYPSAGGAQPGAYPGAGPQPGGYPPAGAPGGAQPPASGYPGAGAQPGAYPGGAQPGAYPGAGPQPGGYPPAGAPGGATAQPPAGGYPGTGPQPGAYPPGAGAPAPTPGYYTPQPPAAGH